MLFSIIVPVYNVEKYIEECIQSIVIQAEKIEEECEILLIDDGSTDTSGYICEMYQNKYPDIIKVFHKKNQGLLLTRRYGYERAKGKYIINCDSDDTLEMNFFQRIQDTIVKYQEPDMIIFNFNSYNGRNKRVSYENVFTFKEDCIVEKGKVLREFLLSHKVVSLCGKVCKRSCIDNEIDYKKFGRLNNGEDSLQSIEFLGNAVTFAYINEALYNYRCDSGMTGKFDENYYFNFKVVFEQLWSQRENWKIDEFDELFAVKVLQTAGRAITQSRYNNWKTIKEHMRYLQKIGCDGVYMENKKYLFRVKQNLQSSHLFLLFLFNLNMYRTISVILYLKNKLS